MTKGLLFYVGLTEKVLMCGWLWKIWKRKNEEWTVLTEECFRERKVHSKVYNRALFGVFQALVLSKWEEEVDIQTAEG